MLNKFVKFLWYITIVFAIWGSALGGIQINPIGLISPYRITSIILIAFLIALKIKKDKRIKKETVFIILFF